MGLYFPAPGVSEARYSLSPKILGLLAFPNFPNGKRPIRLSLYEAGLGVLRWLLKICSVSVFRGDLENTPSLRVHRGELAYLAGLGVSLPRF